MADTDGMPMVESVKNQPGVLASCAFIRSRWVGYDFKGLWPNGSGICSIDLPKELLNVSLEPFFSNVADFVNGTGLRRAYAFGKAGRMFAFVDGDLHPHLWDLQRGREVALAGWDSLRIDSLEFSPDDDLLAAAGNGPTIHLWNPTDGAQRGELTGATNDIRALAFTTDGRRLIAGGDDDRLLVYRREKQVPVIPYREVQNLCRDHLKMSGAQTIIDCRINPAHKGDVPVRFEFGSNETVVMSGLPAPATALTFSKDNETLFAGLRDGTVFAWTRGSNQMEIFALAHDTAVASISAVGTPANHLMTVDVDDGIREYSLEKATRLWDTRVYSQMGRVGAALLADRLIFGGRDGVIETGFHAAGITTTPLVKLAQDSDGEKFLTVHTDGTVRRWSGSPLGGTEVAHYGGGVPSLLAFAPTANAILATDKSRSVRLKMIDTGASFSMDTNNRSEFSAAALSADGKVGALGDVAGRTSVIFPSDGKFIEREIQNRKGQAVTAVALTRQGRFLATAWNDGVLRLERLSSPSAAATETELIADRVHDANVTQGSASDIILLIGLQSYQDGKLSPPSGATQDAQAFDEFVRTKLGWKGATIVRMDDEAATLGTLSKYLMTWLTNHVSVKSRVCIYFSGMGARDISTGTPYLLPYDGDTSYLDETALPLPALLNKLAALPSPDVRLVVDAAFAGGGRRHAAPTTMRPLVSWSLASLTVGRNTTLVLADDGHGRANDVASSGRGYLTSVLLSELSETSVARQRITAADLARYLDGKALAHNNSSTVDQHPIVITARDVDPGKRIWREKP